MHIMKKLLLLILLPILGYGQTTHHYDWGFNTVNQQINVQLGDTVEWTWVGDGSHNLVSTSGTATFDSGYGAVGKKFSFTFTTAGSTTYVCSPHSGNMYGTVNVSESSLSLNTYTKSNHITIYPNPTTSIVTIQGGKQYDIEVYNLQGKRVMALTGNAINMEHLSTATYIVKATDKSNNEELTYKVVKN